GPFAVTCDLAEAHPLLLCFDTDNTPAIITLAFVTAMRCGQAAEVSLGLRVTAIDEPFQICGAQHRRGGFRLRNVDILTFAGLGAVVQCGQNGKRPIRRRDVIRKSSLASRAGPLDFRIPPEISHTRKGHEDGTKADEIPPWPDLAEGLQTRHYDIFANFLHLWIIQSPTRHDPRAEVLGDNVG